MDRPQANPAAFKTPYSPIIERANDDDDDDDDDNLGGGYGCFRRFCLGRDSGGGRGYLLQESVHEEAWYVRKLKQLSEVVAGPKWKNLIRKQPPPFHYSPESYALNFAADQELHTFSARFGPQHPIM